MLVILSPAKTLDFESPVPVEDYARPIFPEMAAQLMNSLKKLSQDELGRLMKISPALAGLNTIRHQHWQQAHHPDNSRQSIYAFKGEVYNGLNARQFDKDAMQFAQQHLHILSGLYGILRPLDLIQPYRLEMGTKLNNQAGKTLYQYWNGKIAQKLQEHATQTGSNTLINLASNEYFKAVKKDAHHMEIITPVFKELKNDSYKVISVYAKKARGLMSAYIIRNRITAPAKLKNFNEAGYMYDDNQSVDNEWVFTRA